MAVPQGLVSPCKPALVVIRCPLWSSLVLVAIVLRCHRAIVLLATLVIIDSSSLLFPQLDGLSCLCMASLHAELTVTELRFKY